MVHLQQAVDLTPTDDLNRAQHLRGLGASLSQRYKQLGNLKDLDAAVSKFGEVLDLIGEDHPHRVKVLENLVASLTDQYQCLGDLKTEGSGGCNETKPRSCGPDTRGPP